MAGDWIKMRSNLWDDPRVTAIADELESSEATVIGCPFRLWTIGDQHSDDGKLPGLTLKSVDRKTGVQGFSAAAINVGWLEECDDGIRIPRFDEHNGSSAKRRAQEARRKSESRVSAERPQRVRSASASNADKNGTTSGAREEKSKNKGAKRSASPPNVISGNGNPSPKSIRDWAGKIDTDEFGDLSEGDARFREFTDRFSVEWPDEFLCRRRWLETWNRIRRTAQTNPQQLLATILIDRSKGDDWGGDGDDDAAVKAYLRTIDGDGSPEAPDDPLATMAADSAIDPDIRRDAARHAEAHS